MFSRRPQHLKLDTIAGCAILHAIFLTFDTVVRAFREYRESSIEAWKTMNLPEKTTLKSCTITIQPRYSETDQGGVIHHSVYPVYFEMGRTELLRANGMAYKDLEAAGVFFVIAELRIKYRRPAFYDEKLNLETIIHKRYRQQSRALIQADKT